MPKSNIEYDGSQFVILVEDDPALRNALTFAFETEGYGVRAYADAEALLAAPFEVGRLCLVIDEKLPGLCGLDLLSRLRDAGVTTPAILITTRPAAITRRRAAAAGVEIVEKPLLGGALARMVCAAFARDGAI